MNNLISIIIPTYNRKVKLKRALETVINQSYTNWETIIVDNKSLDGTSEMVKNLNDPRIKFYEMNNNGIIAYSRNKAIEKAQGKILAFLDSDDWWTQDKLFFSNFYYNKGYKFTYHDMKLRKKNQIFNRKIGYCRKLLNNHYKDLKFNGPAFATSSVVIEKELFSSFNFFREDKKYIAWEDFDAWLRVSAKYNSLFKIDKVLGCINIDDENYLNAEKMLLNLEEFKKEYLVSEKVPNWVKYNIIKSNFVLKKNSNVKTDIFKLDFKKLSLKQFLNLVLIYILLLFK